MIDLVPALPATSRTQEFMAIEEEAAAFHKLWQKGFKYFFRRVKEVDRNETIKNEGKTFSKFFETCPG